MSETNTVFDEHHIWTQRTALKSVVNDVVERVDNKLGRVGIIDPADLINEIDISPILGLQFNGGKYSPFDPAPIVRALFYKHLYDIEYLQGLEDRLVKNPDIAGQLGFKPSNIPERSTLSSWWNQYFSDDIRAVIKEADEKIKNYILGQGIPLDSALYDPNERTGESTETEQRVSEETADEIIRKNRDWVYNILDLDINGNSIYEDRNYQNLMTALALSNSSANDGAEEFEKDLQDKYNCDDEEYVSPSGDSLIYHLKKFKENKLLEMFNSVLEKLSEISDERYKFFDGKVDLAIDENAIPTHADHDHEWITNIRKRKGTNYGFKYITISIVGSGDEAFVLGVLPVASTEDIREKTVKVVNKAAEYVDIRRVYADRGYYDARLINKLETETDPEFAWVIRAQLHSWARDLWEEKDPDSTVAFDNDATIRRNKNPYTKVEDVTRIVVPNESIQEDDAIMAVVTNQTVTEESAKNIADGYSDRWGAETSYRVAQKFRAKTTSKSQSVRLYYYLFSAIMYNLYTLVNAIVIHSLNYMPENPPVTAKGLMGSITRAADPFG